MSPGSCGGLAPPYPDLVAGAVVAAPAQDDQLRVLVLLAAPLLGEGQQGVLARQVEQGGDPVGVGARLKHRCLLQDGAACHGAWGRRGGEDGSPGRILRWGRGLLGRGCSPHGGGWGGLSSSHVGFILLRPHLPILHVPVGKGIWKCALCVEFAP